MFKKDSQDSLYYVSESGREYSLLIGTTSSGYSSDIVFIIEEHKLSDFENGIVDSLTTFVSHVYGGFEDLSVIENIIIDYEKGCM